MLKKDRLLRVSPRELELMHVLWRNGPVTIAQMHRALAGRIGYTTVQTRLNRLAAKGLAVRSDDRPARYSAAVQPQRVYRQQLDLLIERASFGRIVPLVAHLIADRDLSPREINDLKKLIADAERNMRQSTEKPT